MVCSEVQRTLVKSPPELWAELSDPSALARQLGELGDIRVTRVEPETSVEWEGENISGTVSLKPSGWGTRVTISARRELPPPARTDEPAPSAQTRGSEPAEPETEARPPAEPAIAHEVHEGPTGGEVPGEPVQSAPPAPSEAEAQATAADPPADAEASGTAEAEVDALAASVSAEAQTPPPGTRRGFLARLLGWRRRTVTGTPAHEASPAGYTPPEQSAGPEAREEDPPAPARPDAFAAVREALAQASFLLSHAFEPPAGTPPASDPGGRSSPGAPAGDGQAHGCEPGERPRASATPGDISAELLAAEEAAAEEVRMVLTAVLDRLGAAHHRPFSRT